MASRGFQPEFRNLLKIARSKPKLDSLVAEIQTEGGKADCYEVDLSDANATTTCALKILQDHGEPDIW